MALRDINVVPAAGDPVALYTIADDYMLKSGWNYLMLETDGSKGVHHPSFVNRVFSTRPSGRSRAAASRAAATPTRCPAPASTSTGPRSRPTTRARRAACGGPTWRSRTAPTALANVEFILHTDTAGNVTATGAIDPMAQGIFEDVVGDGLGVEGKGALEICSDQPLEAVARIYNTSAEGTFGQALDGISYAGLATGGTARLLGLRQVQGEFRTNINVTNTGMDEAEVEITLYATDGSEVESYSLTVGSGMVVQDLEPFRTRANEPNLGWGFAEVEVLSGSGIIDLGVGDRFEDERPDHHSSEDVGGPLL